MAERDPTESGQVSRLWSVGRRTGDGNELGARPRKEAEGDEDGERDHTVDSTN